MNKWSILMTSIVVLLLVFGSMSCGGGGRQAWETDANNVMLAVDAFYSDLHGGWKDMNGDDNPGDATTFDDNVWGRSVNDTVPGHYFPTAIAKEGNAWLIPDKSAPDPKQPNNPLIINIYTHQPATDAEIQAHAIWMGLLINCSGCTTEAGIQIRGIVSPLLREMAVYFSFMPRSAGNCNGRTTLPGSYCWVVNNKGILGVYKSTDGNWYAGFNGKYP